MEVTSALLCDFAQVREGLLFVVSGGITRVFRPILPAPVGVVLAIVVEMQPDEVELAHEVRVSIVENAQARTIGTVTGGFQAGGTLEPGETLQLPLVFGIGGLPVENYGAHDVRVSVDGHAPRILTFYVVERPGR